MGYYDNIQEFEPDQLGGGLRIGIVMSRFNIDIGEGLLSACTEELKKLDVQEDDILLVTVPGALEIPVTLIKMVDSGQFDVLIALGSVIRGDTYHFEIVANESARGISQIQLETGVPVVNGVLTTDTEGQAIERMMIKGKDAARVAVEMGNLLIKLEENSID
ncbi:MAG: 6,7-dimethyl-8-ribityllumazine synthase [Nitrosomonas sp.]|nr:6,7-dimethyl-8-ribityllumazine synthase [Nitrosomonas sp.]